MERTLFTLLLVLNLSFSAVAQSPVTDREATIERIATAMKQQAGKTVSYSFTQTKHSPMLSQDAVSHGTLSLSGERNMRWHYTDPKDHAIVVIGDSIYTESNGIRKSLSGASGAITRNITKTMIALCSDDALLDENVFSVDLTEDASTYHATLTPKRRDLRRLMQQITVDFDKKNCRIRKVKLTEKHNSYTVIEFQAR